MVAGARPGHIFAAGAAHAAGRTEKDRRALIIRLIIDHDRAAAGLELLPCPPEGRGLAIRVVAVDDLALPLDPGGDELVADLLEDRPALLVIGAQQVLAAPPLDTGGKLPAEIGHILEAVVEPEPAIGRMRMRCVARDEDPARAIPLRHRDAQIPEADVIELASEFETRDLV